MKALLSGHLLYGSHLHLLWQSHGKINVLWSWADSDTPGQILKPSKTMLVLLIYQLRQVKYATYKSDYLKNGQPWVKDSDSHQHCHLDCHTSALSELNFIPNTLLLVRAMHLKHEAEYCRNCAHYTILNWTADRSSGQQNTVLKGNIRVTSALFFLITEKCSDLQQLSFCLCGVKTSSI
jgi:hypothetical protein